MERTLSAYASAVSPLFPAAKVVFELWPAGSETVSLVPATGWAPAWSNGKYRGPEMDLCLKGQGYQPA